jgi:hypothetical protein
MNEKADQARIQNKQGGHHLPPRPDDGPPLDDTDRNTDKIIKPSAVHPSAADQGSVDPKQSQRARRS